MRTAAGCKDAEVMIILPATKYEALRTVFYLCPREWTKRKLAKTCSIAPGLAKYDVGGRRLKHKPNYFYSTVLYLGPRTRLSLLVHASTSPGVSASGGDSEYWRGL